MYEANFEFNTNTIEFDSEINTKDIQANLILNITPDRTSQLINDSDFTTNAALNTAVDVLDERIDNIVVDIETELDLKADKTTVEALSETVSENYNTLNTAIQNETEARINADNLKQDKLTAGDGITINGNVISNTRISANDNTITIQKNGVDVNSFTLNQSVDETINITVPTNNNELVNGAGYQNASDVSSAIATHNTSNNAHQDIRQSITDLNEFTAGTIVPTTTNFVPATKYTVDEALQRTANLFGGFQGEIDDINAVIPNQATAQNQLADKSFVNATIATNSANFRGNWATWADVPTQANLYPEDYTGSRTPTNNDYMVVSDASGYNVENQGAWRFLFVGDWATVGKSGWQPTYPIGTAFTQEQQAAIDSGITSTMVDNYVDPTSTAQTAYNTRITALETDKLDKVYQASKIYGTDNLGGQIAYNISDFATAEQGAKADTALQIPPIGYGTSSTAAATAQKAVSIPSITTLNVGQVIVVQPTATSTVANSTLKLNDFDAYPMRYNNAAITTSTDSTVWSANFPSQFIFDGTYWIFLGHGLDSNTTYTINYLLDAGRCTAGIGTYAVTRYSLLLEKPDGTWEKTTDTTKSHSTATTKTANTRGFLLNHIRYYNTTTVYANGALIAANTLQNQAASVNLSYSTNCGSAPGWEVGDYIYLVGSIGNDGLFYLDTTQWWSNSLPNTNDGKLYIRLGIALTTTDATMSFLLDRPIYYYNGTKLCEYIAADNKQDLISDLATIRSNASTALQPNDDISELNNDAGYTTNVGTVTSVNNVQPDANGNVTITIPDTATWGNITGTLSDQTDLQTALDKRIIQDASLTLFPSGEEDAHVGEIRQYIGADYPLNKKFHGYFYQWTKTQLGPSSWSYGWEQWNVQPQGGGSVSDLSDVELTNLTDGQTLVYDSNSSKWVNGNGGVSASYDSETKTITFS